MNISKVRHFIRNAGRLAACLMVALAVNGAAADDAQPARFLLIFETSPTVKKNLPEIEVTLGRLFASNLQNQIQTDDDLAVWTVDENLHTGTFSLASWSPDDAEMYSDRLDDFLGHQKYTRHATLAAIQPLLNRVVKNSQRLTVLIFCDSQSQLLGTPYDSGMNQIITNAVARSKDAQTPFVLVLRAFNGGYLGGSVNRLGQLNFPNFPAPTKPEPPPEVKPAAVAPAAPVTGPVVTPIAALIIVGTNVSTNIPAATQPAAPAPAATAPPTITATAPPAPPPTPVPIVAVAPPPSPAPISQPMVAPSPTPPPAPMPPPAAVSSAAPVSSASPPAAPPSAATATATDNASSDAGYLLPLVLGGGALVVALGIVLWLVLRSRAPRGSLITSSMRDDPRLPPRK